MRRVALLLLVACSLTALASAADRDVDALVGAMEQEYGLRHTNLPWIARAFMKPALWGKGVSLNIKLFEDQPLPPSTSSENIDALAAKVLDPGWTPFIRSHSTRGGGERTVIYVKPQGKHLLMLIISAEQSDTTILKLKVNPSDARKWMDDPAEMGTRGHRRHSSEAAASAPAD